MSNFEVHADLVSTHGAKLDQIADEVMEAHGSIADTAGAGAGTSAAGAFDDLIAHWSSVMPHFALSGATLSAAMRAAGSNYATADQSVASAAAKSQG